MKTRDLISIIVPIYNIDEYIGFCIESLIKQTYKNIEIILVDDGSTDRSSSICDLYASKDNRIKVIHKSNGGLVSARKAGIEIATGDYIGYVDGDDWVESDYFDSLYKAAVKSGADIVCAGFSRDLFSNHVKCANNLLDGIYEGENLEKLFDKMMRYDNHASVGVTTYVWNKLFKKGVVKEVQLNVDDRITIGEDAAVTYPALLRSKSVYICDNSSYHYRQREGSMLKRHLSFDDETNKIRYLYQYLKKQFISNSREKELISQLNEFIYGYLVMRLGGILSDDLTAFGEAFKGKRVVIVLAGSFGQSMYNRIIETNYCDVVGWYDQDYWEYRRYCMNVDALSDISNKDFDYALIAKTDYEDIETTKELLIGLGIEKSKILNIEFDELKTNKLLNMYLEI